MNLSCARNTCAHLRSPENHCTQLLTISCESCIEASLDQRLLLSAAFPVAVTYPGEWKETMQKADGNYWEAKLSAENTDQLDLNGGK